MSKSNTSVIDKKTFKFLFHPCNPVTKEIIRDGGENSIDREDGKNKYLVGITSGMSTDYHGDRMSKEAIEDMASQALDKDITLYANHNKDYNRAIGIMTKAEVTQNGELYCEYRLWNDEDGVPQQEYEDAQHIWKMINGIKPYTKKRQFGFSIEGYIRDNDIEKTASGKLIKKVDLDPGVSLVTKPAYNYSVASAIMKSIDANKTQKGILDTTIDQSKQISTFYEDRWEIEDAKGTAERAVIEAEKTPQEKQALLEEIYEDYKMKMLALYARVEYKDPYDKSTAQIVNSPGLVKSFKKAIDEIGVLKATIKKLK
jgi:hypothetical protein